MRHMLESVVGPSITLDIRHDDRLWNVRADRMQIERTIMNLAANARDAMPSGGTLTLATANATVPSEHGGTQPPDPGEYVRLEVQDTGRGIAPELVGKVFEPFLSTKGERLGTGLGLAVVYGIVQQCDGFIAVESPSGKGATFTIYLPRTTENVTQPAA
jgi:two-component system cell cycle sensor histidine kinase/response regulator CckA